MAFVPSENTYRVELRYLYDGQKCVNVFHVNYALGSGPDHFVAIADIFKDWMVGLKAFQPSTCSLRTIAITDLNEENGESREIGTGLPIVGTGATAQLPNNVTIAVKWTTGQSGRSFRGRTYHIGLCEGNVVANRLDDVTVGYMTTSYNYLLSALATEGYVLVVRSIILNGGPRFAGVQTPILNATIDPTLDSQRRRLPGRGS